MGNRLDWEFGEEADTVSPTTTTATELERSAIWFWLVVIIFGGVLGLVWQVGQSRIRQANEDLRQQVQRVLDLETAAFRQGDGDLLFTLLTNDPAWQAAQLRPENLAFWQGNPVVTRADAHDTAVWANITWQSNGQTWQRLAFFTWQDNNQLRHAATDPAYWGRKLATEHTWGILAYAEVDQVWADEIGFFVDDLVAELCARGCLAEQLPLEIRLTDGYGETAVPHEITLPSPRLVALTADGQPAPIFWELLTQAVTDHLTTAVLRFGVPRHQPILDYETAAHTFMASHPNIQIEIIWLDEFPDTTLLTTLDGVALTPPADLIAAGLVADLTPLAQTDRTFDSNDFYEQIWAGAHWQNRLWMMPQAGQMRLLFYEKEAYEQAGLTPPSLRWTWTEMAEDLLHLTAVPTPDERWGFIDVGIDSLLAYAYGQAASCTNQIAFPCSLRQNPAAIAAALTWYKEMTAVPGLMPDLAATPSHLREAVMVNWLTAARHAAIWVDDPIGYEHRLLIRPLGVTPFPGSDRFDGITPLWVHGSFMTRTTKRPFATWQWLKFLSTIPPTPRLRLIPARPSIADQTHYWHRLPRPLSEAMRTAFPFTRPVPLDEQTIFNRVMLDKIISGAQSPEEAAQSIAPIHWFNWAVTQSRAK
ncbi:MAG: extracellular solute-binding protein [Chloroflexi bacterium]|nr:MAG: extracellular solute-binding protein [Chloroflexota bacterium]